jgi:hypothetical protein
MKTTPFQSLDVAAAYEMMPPSVRQKLLEIREEIFRLAEETPEIQGIDESLKWGEPSYRALPSGLGSSVRLNPHKRDDSSFGLFFICTSGLVNRFKAQFGERLSYDGQRALVFSLADRLPQEVLKACILQALTSKIKG